MKKTQAKTTVSKNSKNFYAFGTYVPNKMAVPVNYKGTEYLSKAQCMALEGITRKELDAYLNSQNVAKQATLEENFDKQSEELDQYILADKEETSCDILLNE